MTQDHVRENITDFLSRETLRIIMEAYMYIEATHQFVNGDS